MVVGRITSRLSRTVAAQFRSSLLLAGRQNQHHVPIISNQFHSLVNPQNKVVADQLFLFSNYVLNSSTLQKFGISSSASPEPNGGTSSAEQNDKTSEDPAAEGSNKKISVPRRYFPDYFPQLENVREREKRKVDNSNKFAIQSFAKNLLDFADYLGRASSIVKEMIDKQLAADTAGAVPLLKTLLEGVEMTDKQLAAVFKTFGVEKFDPTNEQFDPIRHHAIFNVLDPSKPSGTVAIVLKPGYSLRKRIIRPAQVGVVENRKRI